MLCQSWPSAVPLPGAVCGIIFLIFLKREISRHLWPLPAPRESRFLFAAHGILVHCVFFLFGCFLYYFAKRRCFLNCKSLSCLFGGVFAHRERETTVLQFLKFSNSCGWLRPIASEECDTDNKEERIENEINGLGFDHHTYLLPKGLSR